MIPFYWIISEPITNLRDREILFITAKSAGYVVARDINLKVEPWNYPGEYTYQEERYIKCNGLFIVPSTGVITVGEVRKDGRKLLEYVEILEMMRRSIRQGHSTPILQK